VPIPGARRIARLEENIAAANLTLTDADRGGIRYILPPRGFGARYADAHLPTWI
jgi:aryl-alcohol dehydrogenase-like predicted oxidoreductase